MKWDDFIKIAELLIIPFCAWVVRSLNDTKMEVRSVKEALIGIDGKNGIRSRVEKIERHFFGASDD